MLKHGDGELARRPFSTLSYSVSMRCGPILWKKLVIRTTALAGLLLSIPVRGALAQTAESYRHQAAGQARAKSWDEAIAN